MTHSAVLNYVHPPITEAIIEVIVGQELIPTDLEKIAKQLGKVYSHNQVISSFGFQINHQQTSGSSVAINSAPKGFRLNSEDQADIAIIMQNGLTVARLAPYQGWDPLYKKFVNAWKSWKKVAKTKPISRIGVRYINRIDIPLNRENKIELEDYLTFYPKAPELSHSPMTEYLIRVTQPINSQWAATMTSTLLPPPLINHISLLLDIDIFRTENIPFKDEDLSAVIVEARNIKNTAFQSCITAKAMELFS